MIQPVFTLIVTLSLIAVPAHAGIEISPLLKFQKNNSDKIFYVGGVDLPAQGFWRIKEVQGKSSDSEIYLLQEKSAAGREPGRRIKQINENQLNQRGRSALSQFYRPLIDFALAHDNVTPRIVDELDKSKYPYLFKINDSQWDNKTENPLPGKYVFLVPAVKLDIDARTKRVTSPDKKILAFELQPYLDDGQHWVLFSNGSCVREKIDNKLLAQYGQVIRPVVVKKPVTNEAAPLQRYTIVTLRPEMDLSPVSLILSNFWSGEDISLTMDPVLSEPADETIVAKLKLARMLEWRPYLMNAPANPAMKSWYRVNDKKGFDRFSSLRQTGQRREARLSVFGFLGGRAAVEETLQLQEIAPSGAQSPEQEVSVSSIPSVTVQSHPFAEMLGNTEGKTLPLAEFVPPDRFFVYTAQPKAILPFLDEGASFIADFGGILQATGIRYNLKQKYLRRLGLDNKWLQMFIDSGAVQETALLFPDLFFIDGTDVTVVSRLASKGLIGSLIKLVGVTGLTNENVVTLVLPGNSKVFWALRDDILVFSTSRTELNNVLTLYTNRGEGSLGRSAEFRYMLTQLDHTKDTRFYAYFSDPFIRHLVGPGTKIAQRRRLLARRDLERITSGALLAKLDGLAHPDSIKALAGGGYIPDLPDNGEYSINQDLVARSQTYGTVTSLTTLSDNPVINASASEAASYKQYVDNYNRYWRRFFDPIAIRIEDRPDGSLETTLFILPLIDNTIYNTLREILAVSEDGAKLKVPKPSPPPVTMLSLNLREKQWLDLSKQYLELFQRYTHMSSTFLDDLGPGLHLAIHDADPVIALGSGDILGAFGADSVTGFRGGGALMIPVALSLLTRPCSLYIETGNPDKTRKHLQRATSFAPVFGGREEGFDINFYQLEGLDEWVYSFDLLGLVKLRYGIEIQDNYLVIRNIPWTSKEKIEQVSEAPLNGAMLQAFPAACRVQLPGLFTSAQENSRKAARQGMGYLYPLVASGYAGIDTAAEKHAQLYGFQPVHPGNGHWQWNDRKLGSSLYGSARYQKQPAYTAGDTNFGLLKGIESLSLNMQFEDAGLRSTIRWKLR